MHTEFSAVTTTSLQMKHQTMRLPIIIASLFTAGSTIADNLVLDGQTIPLQNGSVVQIDSTSGDVIATSSSGDLVCGPPTGDPPVVTISANPDSVSSGDSSNISWNVTNGFNTCNTTGGGTTGWANVNVTSSTGSFTATNLTSTTTFSMSCSNNFGNGSGQDTVNVGSSGGFPGPGVFPTGCDTAPNGTLSWQTSPSTYESQFSAWPGEFGDWQDIRVDTNRWVSLWFQTGGATTGKMDTVPSAQDGGDRPKVYSITSCPGDFFPSDTDCVFSPPSTSGSLWWKVGGSADSTCNLEPGTNYYLNIMFANPTNPTTTLCTFPGGGNRPSCFFQGIPRGPWE